jgi:hypothetical protein
MRKMSDFYEKETALLKSWCELYPENERQNFCYDGLIYSRDPKYDDEYETETEARKWEQAKRKVLFLLKDANGCPNDDCDYRFSPFYDTEDTRTYKTFIVLLKWLWALNEVTPDKPCPKFDKKREEYIALALPYPMAVVNVKKIVGRANVSNVLIKDFFEKEKEKGFLKKQVCDILKPNIIVCGGGSGTILEMAKQLYGEMRFEKYNEWCYYCTDSEADNKIMLIDSYHPSNRCGDNLKFDKMIENVQDMLRKIAQ